MKVKKKIGEIFRDEFKAVETTPPDDAWNNIELSLEKNRKRKRVLPFWYRAAGIAAIFAVLMGIIFSPNSEELNSDVTEFSNTGLEPNFGNPSFENFDRIMKQSSTLLRTLVLQRSEMSQSYTTKIQSTPLLKARRKRERLVDSDVEQHEIASSSALNYVSSPQETLDSVSEGISDLQTVHFEEFEIVVEEENKEVKKEEKFLDRLAVSTTAGILYSGNLGNENLVGGDLSSHSSQGETSVSYSFRISYRISDKFDARIGLGNTHLGYTTNEVDLSSAIAAEAVDAGGMDSNNSFIGDLHQNLSFLEVPIELSYALVEKQLGLKLIGGASALFLEKNSLSLNGSSNSLDLGAANNVNDISITGNIGLGVSYSLQNNLHVTLEPVFKYNFNTIKNAPSGMDPYLLGFYSGIVFRF